MSEESEIREILPETVKVGFDSREDAIEIVKEFWEAMPDGKDIIHSVEITGNDWTQELTMGDRTKIIKGVIPNERGKWFVIFGGNHQPLSENAVNWLRTKHLI